MQTPKERVLRAIERRDPDRTPMWVTFSGDPYNAAIVQAMGGGFESDILLVDCWDPDFKPVAPGYSWLGYKMESFGETMGEVKDPPLADWSRFDAWSAALPDYSKPACFGSARAVRAAHPDHFIAGALCMMMEELMNLRGFADYMTDFYEEEEHLTALIDRLYEVGHQMVDGYADAGADAVIAWEDWGLQDCPLMSYPLWRSYFYEKMKAFVDHIHARGMKYILHSCGHIVYLLDSFAEMGIDVIQLDQQLNMGLDTLEKWKDKFCFCCPTDIQHSVRMTEAEMEAYLREMNARLGGSHGGYIFKPYPQPAAIRMPADKLRWELTVASALMPTDP